METEKHFTVSISQKPFTPRSVMLEHRNLREALLFDSEIVYVLSAKETDSAKEQYKNSKIDAYGCLGVLQFKCLEKTISFLIVITDCVSVGKICDSEIFCIRKTEFIQLYEDDFDKSRIYNISELLNSGIFYFSSPLEASRPVLDITFNIQQKYVTRKGYTRNAFFWNRRHYMYLSRYGVKVKNWLIKVICGYVKVTTVNSGPKLARVALISRLSCEFAGTRFNVRGVNDNGHAANFIETEQLISINGELSSFLQIRGCTPIFWEKLGYQYYSPPIKISRCKSSSLPAYNRHFNILKKRYGKQIIVNLLSSDPDNNETVLSETFQRLHKFSNHKDIPVVLFDYQKNCPNGDLRNLCKLNEDMLNYIREFSVFHAQDRTIRSQQQGIIRTNCFDCLDRTNTVQKHFALEAMRYQLFVLKLIRTPSTLREWREIIEKIWVQNDWAIMKVSDYIYPYPKNVPVADDARLGERIFLKDYMKSKEKSAVDLFLFGTVFNSEVDNNARLLLPCNIFHLPFNIAREMCNRYKTYVNLKKLRVAVATYNIDGGKYLNHGVNKQGILSDWLLDSYSKSLMLQQDLNRPVDIFAVGLQDMINEKDPSIDDPNDDVIAKTWGSSLKNTLSRDNRYILVTHQQLDGICLFIFIRRSFARAIKDVAVDSVRTDFQSRGAVAIRFSLFATSFCFVCSHFPGRRDLRSTYERIRQSILFPMGQRLYSHDYTFWCGDFSSKIKADTPTIKRLIKNNEIDELMKNDEFTIQQQQKIIFDGYLEGAIDFHPTSRYQVLKDKYDKISRGGQTPAWTDRILWQRRKFQFECDQADWNPGKLLYYGRSELKNSRHRPVAAVFDIEVRSVDRKARNSALIEVIRDLGPPDGTVIVQIEGRNGEIEDFYNDGYTDVLLRRLHRLFGKISLVRFIKHSIIITFRCSKSALEIARKQFIRVHGRILRVTLKSPDWQLRLRKELAILSDAEEIYDIPIPPGKSPVIKDNCLLDTPPQPTTSNKSSFLRKFKRMVGLKKRNSRVPESDIPLLASTDQDTCEDETSFTLQ